MTLQRYQHTGAAPQTNLSVSMLSTDTSFTAASGTGYPDGSVGLFVVVVDPGLASEEKILCSSRAGAVFTVSGGVAGRGYDNTSAAAHTAPTALIEHVWSAAEADDTSRHIYATASVLSDDHTNYPLLTGARAFTGGVTINTGGLTVSAGNIVASTGALSADLTGTAGRYVGQTNGAPLSGTYSTGDYATDPTTYAVWICTSGGTPGTWVAIAGPTDATWTNVASFTNSWTNNGLPYATVSYRKVHGRIYLRGVVGGGFAGQPAFTLPSSYRPSASLNFPSVQIAGSTASNLLVNSAGEVRPQTAGSWDLSSMNFDTL